MADYTVALQDGGTVKFDGVEVIESEDGVVIFGDDDGVVTGAVPVNNISFIRKE